MVKYSINVFTNDIQYVIITQCYITCVVTCVIMQRNGAGLHTASSCYWDNTSDGMFTIPQYCVTMCTSCVMWYVH